ncbi:glycosyltransferase [Candidatus Pelagibacter ubique]|nr:glycosyltransferase [Candidatus Pelagibacter ubique]
MKIGIFFESSPREGGAFHTNLNIVNIFNEYNKNILDITYIVKSTEVEKILKSKGCKCVFFKSTITFRIQSILQKSFLLNSLLKKFKIKNNFENFLLNQKFDIIYFNSPTIFSTFLEEIPFVMNIYEMQHRTDNYFPEYRKSGHSLDARDEIILNAVKKSFKLIVATEKDKKLLKELYNSYDRNVEIQPYVPQLPNLYQNQYKNENFKEIFKSLRISAKYIFFYPAQFWSHKNHKYIIDIIKFIKKSDREDIKVIFTGHDKGNKSYISRAINDENLNENFIILDYISDKELISLYLNCSALIMPTFVGHSTLPLYEAFYFKLPVFFTEGLLDDKLRDLVYEIDIYKPNNFINNLNKFKNDIDAKNQKLEAGKKFYETNCKKLSLFNNLTKIFNEFEYLKKRWM